MGTQNQTEKSKWYDSIVIQTLLFALIYAVMLIVLLCLEKVENISIGNYLEKIKLLLPLIAIFVFGVFFMYLKKRQDKKQEKFELAFKYGSLEDIYQTIGSAINDKYVKDIVSVIKKSLGNNSQLVGSAVECGIKNAMSEPKLMREVVNSLKEEKIVESVNEVLNNNDSRAIIKRGILNNISLIVSQVSKRDITKVVEAIMENDSSKELIRGVFANMIEIPIEKKTIEVAMQTAFKDKVDALEELEAKRYRFVEKVVEEICRNKDIKDTQINAIRDCIDDIIKVSHASVLTSDSNNIRLALTDIDNKRFEIKYNKTTKEIESAAPDGDYRMTSQIIISIRNNAIDNISTTEKH